MRVTSGARRCAGARKRSRGGARPANQKDRGRRAVQGDGSKRDNVLAGAGGHERLNEDLPVATGWVEDQDLSAGNERARRSRTRSWQTPPINVHSPATIDHTAAAPRLAPSHLWSPSARPCDSMLSPPIRRTPGQYLIEHASSGVNWWQVLRGLATATAVTAATSDEQQPSPTSAST